MIAGHFAFAAAVRSREKSAPMWALMLASQWLDVVFVPLFIAGVETMRPAPGAPRGYGEGIFHIPWTHSLLGAAVLAVVFAIPSAFAWGRRAALVLGGVVLSHWVLDAVVHRRDLPLLPGGPPVAGFGLWRNPPAAAAVELGLVIAGSVLYARSIRSRLPALAVFASGAITLALNYAGF